MKKLRFILIGLLCLLMTACSNEFAKREYDSDEKIAQTADRYAKEASVGNSSNQKYSLESLNLTGVKHFGKKHQKKTKM